MPICNILCMHIKYIFDEGMKNTRVLRVGMGKAVLKIPVLYMAGFTSVYNLCLYVP